MPVTKPSWNGPIGPHMVSPEWQWAWQDMVACIPFSEGTGLPREIIKNITPLVEGGGWGIGPVGEGWDLRSNAGRLIYEGVHNFGTGEPCTVFYYATRMAFSQILAVNGSVTNNSYGQLTIQGAGIDDYIFMGQNDNLVAWNVDGSEQAVLVSYHGSSGGNFLQIISNGRIHTQSTATPTSQPGSSNLVLGAIQTDNTGSHGNFHVCYMWNKGVTLDQAKQLARDPFGPIRPRLWGPELAAAGTAHTRTIFSTSTSTLVDA